jgi:DNA-directed RNA polymerase specialized sigma24 family protein
MLVNQPRVCDILRRIISRITSDPELSRDLLQEALLHLWKIEREKPGNSESWYLQNCRFHLQHLVAAGRSVDALKRRKNFVHLSCAQPDLLDQLEDEKDFFSEICMREMMEVLSKKTTERERRVLHRLAAGCKPMEIARTMAISYPTIIKIRRKIAGLATKLDWKPLGRASSRRKKGKLIPRRNNQNSSASLVEVVADFGSLGASADGQPAPGPVTKEIIHFPASNEPSDSSLQSSPVLGLEMEHPVSTQAGVG